ncbi:Alpha-mannosidase 2 [Mactra antiquata]
MKSNRMNWCRHGNISRKLIRKVLAFVILLILLRLLWVAFYSWNSQTVVQEVIKESEQHTELGRQSDNRIWEHRVQNIGINKHREKENTVRTHEQVNKIVTSIENVEKTKNSATDKSKERTKDTKSEIDNVQESLRKATVSSKNATSDPKNVTKTNKEESKVKTTPESSVNNKTKAAVHPTKNATKNSDVTKDDKSPNRKANVADMFKSDIEAGTCQMVNEWTIHDKKVTSTYDLFEYVDYSMNEAGEYPIPSRSFEDISKEGSLNPLSVILVPFSHADPGYGLTLEQYYSQMSHSTLDNMIIKLKEYPKMTFQWAETVFLARWFEDLDDTGKQDVRDLIKKGQFEVVLGGWVMPDEASPNYIAVVDQLIEGHQWLLENLGIKPTSAWVNDPFGYSSTMPYLWKSSGLDNLVFLRINQPVKAKLMKSKSLDFMWRPYWKASSDSDLLSTLMSYTNYWMGDVCGPDPNICQEFNFLHLDSGNSRGIPVTDENVAERARVIYEQFRITGDLYKYNTIYIGLGEDFSYPQPGQWDSVYQNYEKLINYINSQEDWKMNVKFGTLKEYFHNIRKEEKAMIKTDEAKASFPVLSGDFFPYTERKKDFWTGYFSTRPLNKRFSREIETLVRAADIFNVVAFSSFKYYNVQFKAYEEISEGLRYARRELGMFMHHDGITGTSLPHVVDDYQQRLFLANEKAHAAFKMVLLSLLTKGKQTDPNLLQSVVVKSEKTAMSGTAVIETTKDHSIVMVNPSSNKRKEIVSLQVSSKDFVIVSSLNANTPVQVTHHKDGPYRPASSSLTASFEITIPPFGIEVYKISPASSTNSLVEIFESDERDEGDMISIENLYMKIDFDKNTGLIKRITDKNGKVTNITAQFMVYRSKTSGAYIFGPAGLASTFSIGKSVVKATKGPLMSKVEVTSKGFSLSVILYNTSSIQGHGIHIQTDVDLKEAGMGEMEVILRLQTDVKNGDKFYTDQNGFQFMGRQNRPNDPLESNYYPVTTMAILEDNSKRISLHCRQPHGGASLREGHLEVMLDRHTYRDDGRGLGQGVYDNVRLKNNFVVFIEHKSRDFQPIEKRYTYASEDSILLNDMLQNEIIKYFTVSSVKLSKQLHPMKKDFPCDVTVVGFRNLVKNELEYNGTSLVLHRKPIHCGYEPMNRQCKKIDKITIKHLFPKLSVNIAETSLSHLYNKSQLTTDSNLTPEYSELRSFLIGF